MANCEGARESATRYCTINLARGVHQAMSELAVGREQQQPGCVTSSLPTVIHRHCGAAEDARRPWGGPADRLELSSRRLACDTANLALGRPRRFEIELTAIEQHLVSRAGTIAELCDTPGHGNYGRPDPLLDASARPEPRPRPTVFCSLVMGCAQLRSLSG